ncbi:hypothetical protein ASA1KI_39620 [Opitutales bacterium ASA1]|uniref:hypothetical protein n=1 Tax=Congregicoccus parvus TaxID=3081749 RepID=UPI002B296F60|nr:hypothetical protein ASA1KI_39620 [Opitutales bacterium ASA1]
MSIFGAKPRPVDLHRVLVGIRPTWGEASAGTLLVLILATDEPTACKRAREVAHALPCKVDSKVTAITAADLRAAVSTNRAVAGALPAMEDIARHNGLAVLLVPTALRE